MDLAQPQSQTRRERPSALISASAAVTAITLIVAALCFFVDRINGQKWRSRPVRALSELRLKTGDLLLFSGRSFEPVPTVSFIIKLVTNSDISHVGLVWQDPLTQLLWVWHTAGVPKSSRSAYPPASSRSRHHAHLMSLEDALNPRYGRVYVRPCSHELNTYRMAEFIRPNLGRPYSFDIALHFYNRTWGFAPLNFLETEEGKSGAAATSSTLPAASGKWSCAEMIIYCLVHMGVMPSSELAVAHNYLPKDFSSSNFLRLTGDISYGREFRIELD
jgi:hypothetical protein